MYKKTEKSPLLRKAQTPYINTTKPEVFVSLCFIGFFVAFLYSMIKHWMYFDYNVKPKSDK